MKKSAKQIVQTKSGVWECRVGDSVLAQARQLANGKYIWASTMPGRAGCRSRFDTPQAALQTAMKW